MESYLLLFIYWRLIAPSTEQGTYMESRGGLQSRNRAEAYPAKPSNLSWVFLCSVLRKHPDLPTPSVNKWNKLVKPYNHLQSQGHVKKKKRPTVVANLMPIDCLLAESIQCWLLAFADPLWPYITVKVIQMVLLNIDLLTFFFTYIYFTVPMGKHAPAALAV